MTHDSTDKTGFSTDLRFKAFMPFKGDFKILGLIDFIAGEELLSSEVRDLVTGLIVGGNLFPESAFLGLDTFKLFSVDVLGLAIRS